MLDLSRGREVVGDGAAPRPLPGPTTKRFTSTVTRTPAAPEVNMVAQIGSCDMAGAYRRVRTLR